MSKSFQDQLSVIGCYGCGADNQHGLQLKSYRDGDAAVARFMPRAHHCGGSPDIVYGGLIASLIDCHSCNLAIVAHYDQESREIGSMPRVRCVTAQLNISLVAPAAIGSELELRATITSQNKRKTWVHCEVHSAGILCARGEVLAVRIADAA